MRTTRNESYWPQYGAIFMANKSTRKECFENKLFGLPYNFADFVMEVKMGMLLFLFDFEEKNLYGVFEAVSDGAMNIIPDAYKSASYMKFPAQVRFTTLWHCKPLPEHAFRDAIKENYYDRHKFNFGLSRDQVKSLLKLFENRMSKIPSSPVSEGQDQKRSQMEKSVGEEQDQKRSQMGKSVVVARSCSLDISDLIKESIYELQESVLGMQDSMQNPIPDKLGNLDASELEQSADFIPVPPIEPDEIEQSADFIPVPPIEPDEIEELSEGFQWDDMSFDEVGECLMRPLILPLEHHSSLGSDDKSQVGNNTEFHVRQWSSESSKENSSSDPKINITCHKESHETIGTEVHGMYSDASVRTSAFLRLSGLGKVMAEERHRHANNSKVDNLRGILKELDKRHKFWDQNQSFEQVPKSDLSVFSRLGSYGHARDKDQDVKRKDTREKNARHSKRPRNEPNRWSYHSEKYTSKKSRYASSDVPVFSDESSACTFNSQ